MPACFQLTRKGEREPAILQSVDNAMREHFGAEPSETAWYERWYDTIGLGLALGHSFERLKTEFFPNKAAIIDWLEANYTTDAWHEVGKR